MQMLSYSYTISHKNAIAFGRPQNVTFFGRKFGCKWIIKFLRRLKEGDKQILDFKNLELLKNQCAHINNCKFTKDDSRHVTLLKCKVQKYVEKYLEIIICDNLS